MIVNDKSKFCFVSMPKTGTHTLYDVLKSEYRGYRFGAYHERNLPKWVNPEEYEIFTTVRHPLERFVSAYNSLLSTDDYRPIFIEKVGSSKFEDFTRWVCDNVPNDKAVTSKGFPVISTQSGWLSGIPIQKKLRIEHIEHDFWNKLAFPQGSSAFVFPQKLKREHLSFDGIKKELQHTTFKKLMKWLEPDFEFLKDEYDFK